MTNTLGRFAGGSPAMVAVRLVVVSFVVGIILETPPVGLNAGPGALAAEGVVVGGGLHSRDFGVLDSAEKTFKIYRRTRREDK
jgi:hypothetical protein